MRFLKKHFSIYISLAVFLSFLYFLFVFRPSLYFQLFQPAFYFDRHFLSGFLDYPGGLFDALGLFVFQFFYSDIIGSLLLSLFFLTIFLLELGIYRRLFSRPPLLVFSLVPVAVLFMLLNGYNFPIVIVLKYIFVLLLIFLYSGSPYRRRMLFCVLSPIFYVLMGGWFFLVFTVLILLVHILSETSPVSFLMPVFFFFIYIICSYASARFFYQIPIKEAFLYVVPFVYYYEPVLFNEELLFFIFFASFPLLLLVARVAVSLQDKFKKTVSSGRKAFVIPAIDLAVGLILICAAFYFSIQLDKKRIINIDYLAERKQWEKVLAESKKMKTYDRLVEFHTNRALYFTGALLDDLFRYPHPIGVNALFIDRYMAGQIAMPASDLYFDLGHINASQAVAFEAQTKFTYNPRVLKRLALTTIINGDEKKAEKFLKLLAKSITQKSWAQQHFALMGKEDVLDAELMRKRELAPDHDFFVHTKMPARDMIGLLKTNPKNKMAFEYLAAYFLLECKLRNIAVHLDKMKTIGYTSVPRHIQEAAIMYQSGARLYGQELIKDFAFPRDMLVEYKKFNKTILQHKGNRKAQLFILKRDFGDTFWYYLFAGGQKRSSLIKKEKVEKGIF